MATKIIKEALRLQRFPFTIASYRGTEHDLEKLFRLQGSALHRSRPIAVHISGEHRKPRCLIYFPPIFGLTIFCGLSIDTVPRCEEQLVERDAILDDLEAHRMKGLEGSGVCGGR